MRISDWISDVCSSVLDHVLVDKDDLLANPNNGHAPSMYALVERHVVNARLSGGGLNRVVVFQSHWRVPRKCGVDKAGDSEYTEQRQKCQRRFGKWGFTMIVIEGMDNSGKSTLAEAMASYMGLIVQESEGPPLDAREINEIGRAHV